MNNVISIIKEELYKIRFQENEKSEKNQALYNILSNLVCLYDNEGETAFYIYKNLLNNATNYFLNEVEKEIK